MINGNYDYYKHFSDPFRDKFPYLNLENRFAKIGIITMVVLLNVGSEGDHFFFWHDRKGKVTEARNQFSVIPEGAFQPPLDLKTHFNPDEYRKKYFKDAIMYNIVREFAEELFNAEELITLSTVDTFKKENKTDNTTLNNIFDMLENNCYYLGIGFNPVEGHTELITIAGIDMSKTSENITPQSELFGLQPGDEQLSERKRKRGGKVWQAGDITKKSIESKIKSSSESKKVGLEKFDKETMDKYSKYPTATPGLQMIATICAANYQDILQELLAPRSTPAD
jgi:hypothetical protein